VLTGKPWRLEAIIRLLAGMAICVFLGSIALTCLRLDPASAVTPMTFYALEGGAVAAFLGALWAIARPWTSDQLQVRGGVLLACCSVGFALSSAALRVVTTARDQMTVVGLVVNALSFQGAGLLLIWVFVRQQGFKLRQAFGLDRDLPRSLLLGATAALAFMPVAIGLQSGADMIARLLHVRLPTQDAVIVVRLADSWPDRIALGVVAVVLAPLAEEGIFRGILYPAIKGVGFPQAAMWGTSFLFALIHLNAQIFLPLLVLAVVLVKLYEKTGNLWSSIACHATFNLFNFVMLFLSSGFQESLPVQR
jgi:membrane protease YdiL (CAAX protease family)